MISYILFTLFALITLRICFNKLKKWSKLPNWELSSPDIYTRLIFYICSFVPIINIVLILVIVYMTYLQYKEGKKIIGKCSPKSKIEVLFERFINFLDKHI
jgi:hypothetical protein